LLFNYKGAKYQQNLRGRTKKFISSSGRIFSKLGSTLRRYLTPSS